MEVAKIEVTAIEEVIIQANEIEFRQLNDLQLALIGGGIGEVIVA
jgi:hypothetical protein